MGDASADDEPPRRCFGLRGFLAECKAKYSDGSYSSRGIARGGKRLVVGDRVYDYRAGQLLVATVDSPVTGHVLDTGPGRPTLSFAMSLEPAVITELLLDADPGDLPRSAGNIRPGIAVGDVSDELLDSIVRVLRLLDEPGDRKALVPLFTREIHWWLMTGAQGDVVRQLGLADSDTSPVTRAGRWIRENYRRSFRMQDMTRGSGMSVSAFHRHFQTVTGMSPIRFQKHIRLETARVLLANRPHDISGVSQLVGHETLSQFSREYRRLFGAPPSVDAERMRRAPAVSAAALP